MSLCDEYAVETHVCFLTVSAAAFWEQAFVDLLLIIHWGRRKCEHTVHCI